MKKIIFGLCLVFCCSGTAVFSQAKGSTYKTALGIKFYPGAVTLKHFIASDRALEGIGYFWENGFRLTGLYEFHGDIKGAPGLKWYAGPGFHIGGWNEKWRNRYPERGEIAIGVDGVLGLDYKIKEAPVNLSVDWQPSFNIVGYTYFEGSWGGFAIRYTF